MGAIEERCLPSPSFWAMHADANARRTRRARFEVPLFRATQSWNPCARWLFRARAPALNCARVSPFDDEHEHHPPRRIEHEQNKKQKTQLQNAHAGPSAERQAALRLRPFAVVMAQSLAPPVWLGRRWHRHRATASTERFDRLWHRESHRSVARRTARVHHQNG
jgi:hypothetical protein